MYFKLITIIVFALILNAKEVDYSNINFNKHALALVTCNTDGCIDTAKKQISNEDYYIKKNTLNKVIFIVNINTLEEAINIQNRYKSQFPQTIIKRRYPKDKELYAINAELEDFNINKDYKAKVNANNSLIFSSIKQNKDVIRSQQYNDILLLEGCNIDQWCKIKHEEEYIPQYRLRFIKPLTKEEMKKVVKKYTQAEVIAKKEIKPSLPMKKINTNALKNMSYTQLKNAYDSNMQDENINLYLGLKELENKQYDRSIASFERVLIYNENSSQAKLSMSDAYYNQGSYAYAEVILVNLKKDNPISILTRNQVNKRLEKIEEQKQKHFFSPIFIFGSEYDDNVLSSKDANESDFSYQVVALLNHKYLINNSWTMKNSLLAFQKDYIDTNNRKTKLISYTPTLSKLNRNYILDLSLYFDTVTFGADYDISSYGISPKFKYRYSSTLDFFVNSKYIIKKDQLSTNYDSTVKDILLGVKINKIPYIKGKIKLSSLYTKESSSDDSIDKSSLKLNINYGVKVIKNLSALFDYANKTTDYTNKKDTQDSFTLSSSLNLPELFIVQAKVNHTKNDSDEQASKYEKTTYGLNLIKTF